MNSSFSLAFETQSYRRFLALTAIVGTFLLSACANDGEHMPLPGAGASSTSGRATSSAPASAGANTTETPTTPETTEPTQAIEAGPTFYADALPIFQARCSVCHDGDSLPNWEDPDTAIPNAQNIAYRVTLTEDDAQQMPPGNATDITEDERKILVNWVEAGAPLGTIPTEEE